MNDQIVSALRALEHAALSPQVIRASGAGKAYQSVAQSAAIAVQDATDTLRNISTISTTTIGVAMAGIIATGDKQYVIALKQATKMMTDAAQFFLAVGQNAATVVKGFPSGS